MAPNWPTFLALSLALVVLLGGIGCTREEVDSAPLDLPLVAFESVTLRDLQQRVTAVGELVATQHAKIAAEVEGRVTGIHFIEGASVAAGEPLIELDPAKRKLELASARARVAEAVASVENMRRQVIRQRELFERSIASRATLDDAETALRLAEAQREAARAQLGVEARALEEATVRAPFDGLVVERIVRFGEYVKTGQPLVELVSLDPIEVEFRVAEIDSGFVRVGQDVDVHVAPYPGERFPAKVTVISPTIDPRTRTLRVKAALENHEKRLRPGLFARADLGLAVHADVAVIPSSAILQRVDGSVVFVLQEGDRVERRLVQLGSFEDDRVEVASGLRAGDRVLVRGHADLLDGQVVRIFEAPAAPSPGSTDAPEQAARGEVAGANTP